MVAKTATAIPRLEIAAFNGGKWDIKERVQKLVANDPAFGEALLCDTDKPILRDDRHAVTGKRGKGFEIGRDARAPA